MQDVSPLATGDVPMALGALILNICLAEISTQVIID
jgi:hypothetical protein